MNAYLAYRTRYSEHLHVKPHDDDEAMEAMKSPSVVWVCRHFEAENFDAASNEARRIFNRGEGIVTFAGQQLGLKLPTGGPR